MNRSSLSILITIGVLVGLLLGACGGNPGEDVRDDAPAAQAGAEGQLTIVDARGRTIGFDEAPQRIVVAGRSSLTIVNTLFLFSEAQDRVVGLVVGRQNPGDFLGLVDPAFDDKAVLAVESGPEQIAPLEPDVVILRSFMAEKLGEPLEQLDIPVVYVDLETPEQYFRDVATLGQVLGNGVRAEEINAYYQRKLDHVEKNLEPLTGGQRPGVLLLQYGDKGGEVALNVPSASWIQTTEAELAGGQPLWKEAAQAGGWTVVNFEQIAAWDPDKVFVIHYNGNSAETADQLSADPQWQALAAAQNGEIYGFASDIYSWDQPDPRWILGVMWLAGKIHPEGFTDLDIEGEATQFFEQMYGLDKATIEEEILPTLKGDIQ
jgi:iron complex transport system substrate-binding protein